MSKTMKLIVALVVVVLVIAGVWYWQTNKVSVPNENSSIKVGVLLPFSGMMAFSGLEMQKGLEMCNPGNLKYVYEDSAGDPKNGVSAFNKLTKIDKVDVTLVGMSTVVPAVLPLAIDNKDFVITTITTAANVARDGGKTVFRYYIDGYRAGGIIAKVMNKKSPKSVGVISVKNEYGDAYKNGMVSFFKKEGIIVNAETVLATDVDFSTQLLKLKEKQVDSLLIVAYDKQTLQIVKKIKELGIDTDVYSAYMWSNSELDKNSDVLNGLFVVRSAYLSNSANKAIEFNEKLKMQHGLETSQFASIGCDIALMVGENNLKTYDKLANLAEFSGINGNVKQDSDGEFNFPLQTIQYKDRRLISID